MNGTKALLDTNIIILASKGMINTDELFRRYDEFYVSIVTYIECYGYNFHDNNEKSVIDEFATNIIIVDADRQIADTAIQYRKNPIKKIRLPDAIIAATSRLVGADLITDDWDDFQGIDANLRIITAHNINNP